MWNSYRLNEWSQPIWGIFTFLSWTEFESHFIFTRIKSTLRRWVGGKKSREWEKKTWKWPKSEHFVKGGLVGMIGWAFPSPSPKDWLNYLFHFLLKVATTTSATVVVMAVVVFSIASCSNLDQERMEQEPEIALPETGTVFMSLFSKTTWTNDQTKTDFCFAVLVEIGQNLEAGIGRTETTRNSLSRDKSGKMDLLQFLSSWRINSDPVS